MKFLGKHILVTSIACLLFSWQVSTASQSGDESQAKKRRMQLICGGMEVDSNSVGMEVIERSLCEFLEARKEKANENWTKEEILEVAAMGSQLGTYRTPLAQGIKILELLIHAVLNSVITEKDFESCESYKEQVFGFIEKQNELRRTAITKHNSLLRLDCSQICSDHAVHLTKYFFKDEQIKEGFEILTDSNISHCKEPIKLHLQKHPVQFYYTNNYAAISSDEKLSIQIGNYSFIRILHVEAEVRNIPEKLGLIPERTLSVMMIFHPEMKELLRTNSDTILSRIRNCGQLITKGDLDFDSFKQVFPILQNTILATVTDFNSVLLNNLNLFTGVKETWTSNQLFKKKPESEWKLFRLFNLSNYPQSRSELEKECENNQIVIIIDLDQNIKLEYLSDIIENDKIIGIHFNFWPSFHQYEELLGIIKKRTFKAFIFHGSITLPEENSNFISKLKQDSSYWESVDCLGSLKYSLKTAIGIFQNSSSKLEKVSLLLSSPNEESIDKIEITSVKELNLTFHYDKCQQSIANVLSFFPNLEKVTIDSFYTLLPFEIQHQSLFEVKIKCPRFKDQPRIFAHLATNPKLKSVSIEEKEGRLVEWQRDGNQVYFKFDVNNKNKIYYEGIN